MNFREKANSHAARVFGALLASLMIVLCGAYFALLPKVRAMMDQAAARFASQLSFDPWTAAQTVKPADLVKELASAKGANRPVIVCAGFRVLYYGAHVPGAVFHGPAAKPEGLDDLKQWAQGIPRSANLIVYCGCCPPDHCPNIRPAFEALRSMGFQHLRVLVLPNSLAKDWVELGYPVEKGM
jgi:hypothetical protein